MVVWRLDRLGRNLRHLTFCSADVCLVGLIHVNKSQSNDPLTTLMASRAFAAVARAVLFVMADPEDDKARLLGQAKNNLGRIDLPTLRFRVSEVIVAQTDEGPVKTGRLEWMTETDRTIADAMAATNEGPSDRTATSEAGEWLRDYLQPGRHQRFHVDQAARIQRWPQPRLGQACAAPPRHCAASGVRRHAPGRTCALNCLLSRTART